MIDLHDKIVQDGLTIIIGGVLSYFLKFSLRPSKDEVRFMAQMLSLSITLLLKWANDHKFNFSYLTRAKEQVDEFGKKISNKIELG